MSPFGQILRGYRVQHGLTQEQLAPDLGVDVRTLKRWEAGITVITDVRELRRIAQVLGLDPVLFGVAPDPNRPLEELEQAIARAWALINQSRYYEARALMDLLTQELLGRVKGEGDPLLITLAWAYNAGGYATSMASRTSGLAAVLHYYNRMEETARAARDATALNIALTYEGDMLRRGGDLAAAQVYLEEAAAVQGVDIAAQGNAIQLLGRAHWQLGNVDAFNKYLDQSAEITTRFDAGQAVTNGQYSLGSVYEEWGRAWAAVGDYNKALDYLDKAEALLPATLGSKAMIMTARADALVRAGHIKEGIALATEAAQFCLEHRMYRLLERVYATQAYLDDMARDITMLSAPLKNTLNGPIGL